MRRRRIFGLRLCRRIVRGLFVCRRGRGLGGNACQLVNVEFGDGNVPALFRVPARLCSVCLLGSTPSVKEKSLFAISMVICRSRRDNVEVGGG